MLAFLKEEKVALRQGLKGDGTGHKFKKRIPFICRKMNKIRNTKKDGLYTGYQLLVNVKRLTHNVYKGYKIIKNYLGNKPLQLTGFHYSSTW